MKKVFFASVLFLFSLSFVFSQVIKDGDEQLSPFVGTWRWVYNIAGVQDFDIIVGERNDSLFFAMSGIFEYGGKLQTPEWDELGEPMAHVRVKKKDAKIVRSKIHTLISSFFLLDDNEYKYNDISFELLDDTVMLFILNDGFYYWPDTALLIRYDRENHTFSLKEEPEMYKGEVE